MYDERVSQEDMDRVYEQGYKKGYEDGVESERPRAFGAGYKAGYDNAAKIVRCKDCKYFYRYLRTNFKNCELHDLPTKEDGFCSWAERRE